MQINQNTAAKFMSDRPVKLQERTDYDRIGEAIRYLEANFRDQPSLEELAEHMGLSPFHVQKLFSRWAGLSPKKFLQLVTHSEARALLAQAETILDTAYDVGLSGPGRLHDLFVNVEAMSPGEVKAMGAGLVLTYGFHPSPFGEALYVMAPRGLAGIAFADDQEFTRTHALDDMKSRWPMARFVEDPNASASVARSVFNPGTENIDVCLMGTPFQIQVWKALLAIPAGAATTYGDIAQHIDRPKAVRAVGTAVGRNPISFLIPCHRVLRKSGALGGYHWGLTRKRAILVWEQAQIVK